jgi:hypothetical protein
MLQAITDRDFDQIIERTGVPVLVEPHGFTAVASPTFAKASVGCRSFSEGGCVGGWSSGSRAAATVGHF